MTDTRVQEEPALLDAAADAVSIRCVTAEDWPAVEAALPSLQRRFAAATGFAPQAGSVALLPGETGALGLVLLGLGEGQAPARDRFLAGKLPAALPSGDYRFEPSDGFDAGEAALAWLLGSYRFERYRKPGKPRPRLVAPEGVDAAALGRVAAAVASGRDLVNTPANDLGPAELEGAVRALAERFGAAVSVTLGADLEKGFPLVHAVGAASPRAPRLIDLTWGPAEAPRVTLVGKGVVFDTGGLDVKPASNMLLMKKDMGGAAAALAAAEMIMGAGLAVRLRLIVPSVENAIAGDAFRPGDVIRSRAGLTVEIGNTDAEGRLILVDALTLADADAPDLLIDFATLTGAARVALGPDLPAFFTEDAALAQAVAAAGERVNDPVWRLPLHAPYASLLDSKVADLNNAPGGPFAGAITAALFLRRFAPRTRAHVHFDLFGWNPATKPGRPEGGEVQTARLAFALVSERHARRG
ncbi:MAG: leucyl aminopeptidase family protein [Methylorubrum populi]